MRTIAKAALGALALASLGAIAATPASAQSFGFSFGTGPYYGGYYGYRDPCFRPYAYRPYYCRPAPVYRYYGRPYYRPYAYSGYRDYRRWDRDRRRWYR